MGNLQRYLGGFIGTAVPSSGVTPTNAQPGIFGISGQYYMKEAGGWTIEASQGMAATGGTTTTYTDPTGSYKSHTFTSTGSFVVTSAPPGPSYDCEFYLQAGGGGSDPYPSGNREAGSGGGGALYGPAGPLGTATYPVSIGAGGNAGNGSNSVFATPSPGPGPHTALGGGRGGAGDGDPGNLGSNGGCGGGAWYINGLPDNKGESTQTSPHPTITALGNPGGNGSPSPEYGGAGGGTGGAGGRGAAKGPGTANVYRYGPTNPQSYGDGGMASDYPSTNRRGAGGANTGAGSSAFASGGSGILVIRYKV